MAEKAELDDAAHNRIIRIESQHKLELTINGKPRVLVEYTEEYINDNPGIALWSTVLHAYGHRRN